MGMLGQHRDSTAARAQHGDSMGMLGQHGDSTAKGQSQGGTFFSGGKWKKKEEGRTSDSCVFAVVLLRCWDSILLSLPSLLSYISMKAFSLHARHARATPHRYQYIPHWTNTLTAKSKSELNRTCGHLFHCSFSSPCLAPLHL